MYGKYLIGSDAGEIAQGINKYARTLTSVVSDSMSAISKTMDSGGVLNTLLGKNREVLESNVKDALRSSRSMKETGIHGRPMLVEQLVNDSARTRSVVEGSMLDLRKEIVLSAFDGKERQLAERALLANDGALAHMSFRKPIQKLEGPLKPADRDRVRANIEDLVKKTNVEHSLDMDSALREKLVNGLVETNRQDFLQMIRPGSANYRQDYRTRLKQRVSVMMDAVERAELQALKSKTKPDSFTVGDYITQNIRRQTTEQHGYFKDVKGSRSQEFRQQTFDNVKRIQAFSENVRRKFGEEAYMDFMSSAMDPHVFLRNKEIVDKRVVRHAMGSFTNTMAESFQVPFIGLRPFKMINLWDKENIQKMPRHVLYSAGQRAPTLAKDRLTESMVYANGSVFRYNAQSGSAEIVSDNMTMASSRLGSIAHTFSNMAGESRKSGEPYANLLAQWFDVGRQEYPSIFKRLLSAKGKYEDPDFILNVVGAAAQPGSVTAPTIRKAYNKTLSLLERNAAPIDSASMNALSGYLLQIPGMDPARLSGILGGTVENRAMKGLQEVLNIRGESRMPLINEKKLRRIRAEYMRDQDAFGAIRHVQSPGDEMDITPGLTELISSKERRLFTGFDEAERSSQIELLHLASSSSGIEVPEIVEQLLNSGKIGKKQARTIKDVWAYGELGKLSNDAGHLEDMFVGKMAGIFQNNGLTGNASALHDQIMDRVGRSSKWFTEGALDVPPNAFADNEFIPVRKAVNPLASINQVLKSGGNIDDIFDTIGKDLFGQLGFGPSKYRAGRQNMQDITTLTHGAYFYLSRLSEGLGTLGLGLSRDKMGDTQQLAANLLGRRFILPLAGIAAVGYGNFLAGEALGEKPSQTLSATYANATIGMKAIKDITGLTGLSKRMSAIFPGSKHLFDNPVGGIVKYASLGLIGDDRNAKETLYDYEHGMDPVRKGRFWGWGSTTPYYGGRVEFHKPNWYRLEMGQPEMTDVLYGSEREYWSQHWLPTLHNPLGPLKRIIDPYHWERKHEKDRPYPVSGGVPELEQLPLVGPALAGTVGKLIKPTRKYPGLQRAHEEYLREINTRITDFVKTADSGALITVSPGGQVTPVELTGDLTSEVIGPQDGEQTQGAIRYVGGTGGSISSMGIGYNGPGGGVSGMGRGGGMAVSQLRGQNNWIKAQNVKPIDGRSINLLRDAAYVDSLDQAVDPNSTRARLSETWYSMTEIGGIYGFAATSLLGEMAPRTMLDSSSRMTSMERKWWDKRMGGLGGELSEIGRRFLPHKQNQIQRYNPIRNQMPDWMPGLEYMQDFKHGDPYCVSKDTLIEIGNLGFERADAVSAGAIVTTHTGTKTPVATTKERPIRTNERVYSFKVASLFSETMELSEEHPVLVLNVSRLQLRYPVKRKAHKPRVVWRQAKDISVGDYVAYPRPPVGDKTIVVDIAPMLPKKSASDSHIYVMPHNGKTHLAYEELEKLNFPTFKWGELRAFKSLHGFTTEEIESAQLSKKLHSVGEKERVARYVEIDEDVAYLCGIYTAEGSLANGYVNLAHHIKEKPYSDRAILGARKIHPQAKCSFKRVGNTNGATTSIFSTIVQGFLECTIGSSFDKKRVPEYFAGTKEPVIKAFLKGLFDGDGSLFVDSSSSEWGSSLAKFRVSLALSNPVLMLQIRKLLLAYGFVMNISKNHGIIRGVAALKFAKWIGYDIPSWINDEVFEREEKTWTIVTDDYIYMRVCDKMEIDTVRTVFGFQVDVDDSFCISGVATHNTKIPYGESRLPGAGYEAINKLHPDVFGKYGALDRMRILADVAPWSEQFKYYSKVVSQMRAANMLSEEDTMLVEEARQMVSARKQKYELNPYRFVDAKIEKKKVTVTRIIDDTTFMTAEMPWAPVRLAGIKLSAKDTKSGIAEREMIREHIKVGQELQIGIDADYLNRIRDDTMGTIHAAVYDGYGDTLQRRLTHTIGSKVKTDMENPDPVATHALFTGFERGMGRGWERFAHLDTPIHCVAPFTQIITAEGAKEADSVEAGDLVLTHKGNFKRVVGVEEQAAQKDVYEIKLASSNIPLVVTYDHPVLAVRSERKKRITSHGTGEKLEPYGKNPQPEFVWASDLRPYDYVVYTPRTMNSDSNPIVDLSTLGGDRFIGVGSNIYGRYRGGKQGKDLGPRHLEITRDVARLLGYYCAEGCVSGRANRPTYTIFTFSSLERVYVDDVCRIIKNLGMNPRVSEKGTVTSVTVGSSLLSEFMAFYVGTKIRKKAPEELLSNDQLRAEFIRGLFRGDGTKAGHQRYDSIGMAVLPVLLWARDALFDLWGIASAVAIQARRENTLYCLRVGTFPELADFIDGDKEYEERYFSQAVETRNRCRVNNYILYRIQSVKLAEYQGKTIDIEVEDDDTFATINADVHNTKFLQIRSPLEMYERNLIYGKEWRSWNHPFRDWVKPTLDRISTNSPIMAVGIGALTGSMFSWKGKAKGIGALVGGVLGGLGSMNRVLQESTGRLFGDRSAWVPKRVQKIREINEYFDALKYVKYKGLYEKTRQMAIEYEGIDPELIANYAGEGALKSKKARRALKEMKKGLKLAQNRDDIIGNETAKEKIKVLNQMENSYGKVAMEAGPLTLRALQYRKEYESTLMGADPSGDVQAIYAALPKSDRYFFKYFSTASPREREKILRLVPKNQRRFYQAQWGLPVEKAPTAQAFFSRHALPGQNWSGWRPDVSLESVKLKTIDHLGLDASDFGFMPDDLQEIPRTTPRTPAGAATGGITIPNIPALMAVLAGKGIQDSDIRIEYTTTNDPMDRFGVSMDLRHDRRQDVNNEINRWVAMGSPV